VLSEVASSLFGVVILSASRPREAGVVWPRHRKEKAPTRLASAIFVRL
jgi:hypothetical protein